MPECGSKKDMLVLATLRQILNIKDYSNTEFSQLCYYQMKWRNNKDFQTLAQNRRNINSLGKLQDYTTTTYIKLVLYFSYYQTCSRIKHPLQNYCLVLLQVLKYFGLVQIFCARPKVDIHDVPKSSFFFFTLQLIFKGIVGNMQSPLI